MNVSIDAVSALNPMNVSIDDVSALNPMNVNIDAVSALKPMNVNIDGVSVWCFDVFFVWVVSLLAGDRPMSPQYQKAHRPPLLPITDLFP